MRTNFKMVILLVLACLISNAGLAGELKKNPIGGGFYYSNFSCQETGYIYVVCKGDMTNESDHQTRFAEDKFSIEFLDKNGTVLEKTSFFLKTPAEVGQTVRFETISNQFEIREMKSFKISYSYEKIHSQKKEDSISGDDARNRLIQAIKESR